jgi:predicted secreted protein
MANINNPDEGNWTVIKYPCPTVSILLHDMIDETDKEEIPAE